MMSSTARLKAAFLATDRSDKNVPVKGADGGHSDQAIAHPDHTFASKNFHRFFSSPLRFSFACRIA